MKYLNKNTLRNIVIIVMSFISSASFAKDLPAPRMDNTPCGNPGNPCDMPIDDYLPLLFFAALLLGVWALNRLNNKELVKVKS